jgi:hypothetical protein
VPGPPTANRSKHCTERPILKRPNTSQRIAGGPGRTAHAQAIDPFKALLATAADFKARESAVAMRRRMIQLAPAIVPAKWSNPELAKHFDVSGTAVSNIRKEAPKRFDDCAYLLCGLIGMALTYCGEPETEQRSQAAAARLLTAEVRTAKELQDLFKGTFSESRRRAPEKGPSRDLGEARRCSVPALGAAAPQLHELIKMDVDLTWIEIDLEVPF